MKTITKKEIVVLILLLFLAVPLVAYNVHTNEQFLSASLTSIINVLAIVYISFYLTQMITDRREKSKLGREILADISNMINKEEFFLPNDEKERQIALIMQRRVGNKIEMLEDYKLKKGPKEELEKLSNEFKNARELFGNHMGDLGQLQLLKPDFENSVEIIDTCCERISCHLY